MANPEHLAILKRGVEEWNAWREKHPDVRPDLSEADLSGANLRVADLRGANLSGADLSGADLRGADLNHAVLDRADLRGADLIKTDLSQAELRGADLGEAILLGTLLQGSVLEGTELNRTYLGSAVLADLDLSTAKGLDSVNYAGPSTLGVDTLYKSKGQIPDVFLRGVGLPEEFITYAGSLVHGKHAIQFYSCFISYSHEDKAFARRLHDQLQGRGIRCWLDEHQLKPGDDIYEGVDRGIRLWDKVLLCCSEASLTSWWVEREVDTAIEKERQLREQHGEPRLALIPLNLDGSMFDWKGKHAATLRSRLAADFTGWEQDNAKFEAQLERVVEALRSDDQAREAAPEPKL